jgi:hypothetical protein
LQQAVRQAAVDPSVQQAENDSKQLDQLAASKHYDATQRAMAAADQASRELADGHMDTAGHLMAIEASKARAAAEALDLPPERRQALEAIAQNFRDRAQLYGAPGPGWAAEAADQLTAEGKQTAALAGDPSMSAEDRAALKSLGDDSSQQGTRLGQSARATNMTMGLSLSDSFRTLVAHTYPAAAKFVDPALDELNHTILTKHESFDQALTDMQKDTNDRVSVKGIDGMSSMSRAQLADVILHAENFGYGDNMKVGMAQGFIDVSRAFSLGDAQGMAAGQSEIRQALQTYQPQHQDDGGVVGLATAALMAIPEGRAADLFGLGATSLAERLGMGALAKGVTQTVASALGLTGAQYVAQGVTTGDWSPSNLPQDMALNLGFGAAGRMVGESWLAQRGLGAVPKADDAEYADQVAAFGSRARNRLPDSSIARASAQLPRLRADAESYYKKNPAVKSYVARQGLPTSGPFVYVPPSSWRDGTRLPRQSARGLSGYVDQFGNVWVKDPTKQGQWDVQVDVPGARDSVYRSASIDKKHTNVWGADGSWGGS